MTRPIPTQDPAQIVVDLAELLMNFQDREYSGKIDRDTWFFADLGFASIDAVVLGEKLQEMYGQAIPFHLALSSVANHERNDICVGELADFLAQHLKPGKAAVPVTPVTKHTINGVPIHYQQDGDGDDVILIHAFTSNLSVWALSGIVPTLACDYRVTAYDLRGHGLSGVTRRGYNSKQMANDLAQLHRELDLGTAHLVGHSFGGVIAMHAALDHPEMVSSVTLSDTYFPGLRHLEPEMDRTEVWTDLRDQLREFGTEMDDRVNFGRLFEELAEWTPRQVDAVSRELGAPAARWLSQLARLAGTTAGDEVFEESGLTAARLCEVRQPVVALYDEFSPFGATRDFLENNLANCHVDIVPGAKHLAPVQNPAGFVALVQENLQRLREPTTMDSAADGDVG